MIVNLIRLIFVDYHSDVGVFSFRADPKSDLKQILSIRIGKVAEISERSARSPTMAAHDLRRRRSIFRAVEDDA